MIPYADDTPSYSPPIWIILLIGLNILFFALSYFGGIEHYIETIFAYGCIPARFFLPAGQPLIFDLQGLEIELTGVEQSDWVPPFVTLFTSMFLHGGLFHLLGNVWFLWLFGDNVECRMGKMVFPIFYIVCGLFAAILHVLFEKDSVMPAIGASGAIAGVMGAYIYLFPRATIATLTGYWFYIFTLHIPAPIYLGLWFLLQLAGGLAAQGACNVAFWAHIGGFVAGLLIAMLLNVLKLLTWYPGDRGYTGYRIPLVDTTTRYTPRRKRRYTWRS